MRKSHWLWLCAVVAVVALALLAWRLGTARRPPSVRLADGRILTIQSVTFGTEHKFAHGRLWSRIVAPVLPAKWKPKLGVRTVALHTARPCMMIWGACEPAPKANRGWLALIKEDDEQVRAFGAVGASGLVIWTFENFPRRAAIIPLQISEWKDGTWSDLAFLELPNPIRTGFPVWHPQPFPIATKHDDMQFELLNFSRGVFADEPWLSNLGRAVLRTGYVATVRIKQEGSFVDDWIVEQAAIADATGNRSTVRVPRSSMLAEYSVFGTGKYLVFGIAKDAAPLWSSETAWKLTPQFIRVSGFASNELCSHSKVPVPGSGATTQILVSASANGLSLMSLELRRVGGGSFWPQPIRQDLEIWPLVQTNSNRQIMLYDVSDDRGRRLRNDRSYYHTDGKHFGIELLPDSKTLDLTFAVQEPISIEFLVGLSPPLQTNGATAYGHSNKR